jgi:hypothetical protein
MTYSAISGRVRVRGCRVPSCLGRPCRGLELDFYSPHIYPEFSRLDGYDRQGGFDRFAAKLHWQSRSCPIAWLIGETAFAADDDAADPMDLHNNDPTPILVADPRTKRMPYMMGSEQDQADFFTHSMDAVRATKGSGYSWWGFQNGRGHPLVRPENFDLTILDPETGESVHKSLVEKYHHNFWGPLKYGNPAGLNLPAPWNVQNRWRDKTMVATMQNYTLPPAPTEMPPPPSNYYNWYNLNTSVWRDGYIKDQNDEPVADAVIEVPWDYVLHPMFPPPMPAWNFTEWMPYATDEQGYFSILEAPDLPGYTDPIVLPGNRNNRVVSAAGGESRIIGPSGTTTNVVRNFLPYSSSAEVYVVQNETKTYKSRVDLDVTVGSVEGGANGGVADLFAGHSVHLNAPFRAQEGSSTHIYTTPVFADCPTVGSGMIPEPGLTNSPGVNTKSRSVSIQLRFEALDLTASAFPSPTTEQVTLQTNAPSFTYSIFDSHATLILQGNSLSNSTTLSVSALVSGIYQCSISFGSRTSNTSFLITR